MSALKPYEPTSTHWDTARERDVDMQLDAEERESDSREKLEADVRKHFTHSTSTAMWPPSANKVTDWLSVSMETVLGWLDRQAEITEREITSTGVADWCASCSLRDGLHLAMDAKEGLRKSLDETIAERNALVRCLESDCGMRASWDGLRKFWTIEATSEHMDARRALLAKVSEMECTWIPLPVDANGVPCRIGDVLDCDEGRHEVMAVSEDCVWFDTDAHDVRLTCCESRECRHVQPDTVESLLEEFHGKLWSDDEEQMAMLEEYAERIRRACNG